MATPGTIASLATASPEAPRLSAVTGEGVPELVGMLRKLVEAARDELPADEGFVTLRPAPEGIEVTKWADGTFEVNGREALRAVAFSDLTDEEALAEARKRLSSLGLQAALERAGIRDGDTVVIGDFEFDYEADS